MKRYPCCLSALLLSWIACISLLLSGPLAAQENTIRVALFIDEGTEASEFRKEFRRNTDPSIIYQKVNGEDIGSGILRNFDALVIPGGSATTEAYSMGPAAREEVRRFVREGGIYLGVCAGAYLASKLKDCYLGMLPLKTLDEEHWYRTSGAPLVDVELTEAGMEVFGIKERNVRIVYEDGPIFAPPFEPTDPSFAPLGFFRSEVVAPGGQPGVMIGAPAIIFSKYGRGAILVISPHPEETPGMKQAELRALRWLYEHRSASLPEAHTASGFESRSRSPNNLQTAGESKNPSTLSTAPGLSKRTESESGPSQRTGNEFSQRTGNEFSQRTGQELSKRNGQEGQQQYPQEPASPSLSQMVLRAAMRVFEQASIVRYKHNEVPASEQIEVLPNGSLKALTDCSGFVSYVVHKVAPRHYAAVRSREPEASYPQAKIWARFFASLERDGPSDGWLGISDWRQLAPGDIVAWKTGEAGASNTGHVMIVAGKAGNIQQERGFRYVEIPVVDSSSVYHFKPETLPPLASQSHRNGLGCGSVRLVLSEDNTAIGYWEGSYWGEGNKPVDGPTFSKVIHFARLIPLAETDH